MLPGVVRAWRLSLDLEITQRSASIWAITGLREPASSE
jgi:hypothetical protein